MEIEYKEIKNHNNFILSSDGRIWDKKKNKETDYFTNIIGRKAVNLDNKDYSLDLLIATHFNIDGNGFLLRFRDGNTNNITAENLYWYEPTDEEMADMEKEVEEIEIVNGAYSKKCFLINTDGSIREVYNSIAEMAYYNNYYLHHIYNNQGKYLNRINGYVYKEYNQDVINDIRTKEIERYNRIEIYAKSKITHKNNIAYIINTDGTIRAEINKYTDLSEKYNTSKQYWRNLSRQATYNAIINGYLIPIKDWSEVTKEKILEKENKRIEKEKIKADKERLKIKKQKLDILINKQRDEWEKQRYEKKVLKEQQRIKRELSRENKRIEKENLLKEKEYKRIEKENKLIEREYKKLERENKRIEKDNKIKERKELKEKQRAEKITIKEKQRIERELLRENKRIKKETLLKEKEYKRLEKEKMLIEKENKKIKREKQRAEKEALKEYNKNKRKVYIVNLDWKITHEYECCARIPNNNKIRYDAYMKEFLFSSALNGYIVNAMDWDNDKEAIIQKIKDKQNGRWGKNKRIGKYDKEGNLIKLFNNVKEAKEEDGSSVGYYLANNKYNNKGFIYKYLD